MRLLSVRNAFFVIALCATQVACLAAAQDALRVNLSLSNDKIVLGEPVWIVLRVTNISKRPQRVDPGSRCFGQLPLQIEVPNAQSGPRDRAKCAQGFAGSCLGGALPVLAQGETLTERYLLQQALDLASRRIENDGEYEVFVDDVVHYGEQESSAEFGPLPYAQSTAKTLKLQIAPEDASVLELDEQRLGASLRPPSMVESWTWDDETAHGISSSPSPGLEPLFREWLKRQDLPYRTYAVEGLKRINTATAHADLVELAKTPGDPLRQSAIVALTDLADPGDLDLFEQLAANDDDGVRYGAIRGVGLIGGAKEVPFLATLLSDGRRYDRTNALMALGDTGSKEAVSILIAALVLKEGDGGVDDGVAANNALSEMTHHSVPEDQYEDRRTRAAAWQSWWFQNERTAILFGPYECMSAADSNR